MLLQNNTSTIKFHINEQTRKIVDKGMNFYFFVHNDRGVKPLTTTFFASA